MTHICIIPARGGSKRIPKKNIKSFHGKPMIAYSIECAIKSGIFNKIIVSTDDAEIASVAQSYGADVPFMRPKAISDDFTGTADVIAHAIYASEQIYKTQFLSVCCLYATAPFVQKQYLVEGYNLLNNNQTDFVIPVTQFPFPIQRAVKKHNNMIVPFSSEDMKKRSQDLDDAYHDVGQFYWGTRSAWLEKKDIWSHKIMPIIIPRHLAQDIDTPEDWRYAEIMYQVLDTVNEHKIAENV
jgi:pseudaminic acid cytidylyltransferase